MFINLLQFFNAPSWIIVIVDEITMEVRPVQLVSNVALKLVNKTFVGNVNEVIPEQPLNALTPIVSTESGITIERRFVQPLNVLAPIVFNKEFVGNVMEVKFIQFLNALPPANAAPKYVTVSGILHEIRLVQPRNAFGAIDTKVYVKPLTINVGGIDIIPLESMIDKTSALEWVDTVALYPLTV